MRWTNASRSFPAAGLATEFSFLQPLAFGLSRALAHDVVVRLVALVQLAPDQLETLLFVVDGQDNRTNVRVGVPFIGLPGCRL
jgi:hypothetical protein